MRKRSTFGHNKAVERLIDELLDKVSEAGMLVAAIIHRQLESGPGAVDDKLVQVLKLKRTCSRLRREIEAGLYTEMLIPDLLGDVAALIESVHQLVERMHHHMHFGRYSQVTPPPFMLTDGKELATAVGNTVESLVLAVRAFFRDFTHVRDFVHKVGFYESECDEARDRLLKKIYSAELDLALKDHLAMRVREIDGIADAAERISDALTIYTIKRAQ